MVTLPLWIAIVSPAPVADASAETAPLRIAIQTEQTNTCLRRTLLANLGRSIVDTAQHGQLATDAIETVGLERSPPSDEFNRWVRGTIHCERRGRLGFSITVADATGTRLAKVERRRVRRADLLERWRQASRQIASSLWASRPSASPSLTTEAAGATASGPSSDAAVAAPPPAAPSDFLADSENGTDSGADWSAPIPVLDQRPGDGFGSLLLRQQDGVNLGGQVSAWGARELNGNADPKTISAWQSVLELETQLQAHYGAYWSARGSARAAWLPLDSAATRLDLTEAQLQFTWEWLQLSAGRLRISWGTVDLFSPTDLWTSLDLSDPLRPVSRGEYAAQLSFDWDIPKLDLVVAPLLSPHRLPGSIGDRAVADLGQVPDRWVGAAMAPESQTLRVDETARPAPEAESMQVGCRLRASVGPFDLGAFYYRGWERAPYFSQPHLAVDLSQLEQWLVVSPVFRRQQVAAASAVATALGFAIRAEGAAFWIGETTGDTPEPSGQYQTVAVSIDRTFAGIWSSWELTVLAQYQHRFNQKTGALESLNVSTLFSDAVAGHLSLLSQQSAWQFSLSGLVTIRELGGWVGPEISYGLSESLGLRLSLNADVLWGAADSLLGRFARNSRVGTQLKWTF